MSAEHDHVTWVEEWMGGQQGRCSCGWRSEVRDTAEQAEHHIGLHQRDVARINTKNGVARLDTVYRYYREQSENEEVPQRERDQWKTLADEIGQRLGGLDTSGDDQLGLW